MKAIEYYEKYKTGLLSEDNETYIPATQGLISDLLDESRALADKRHVQFDRGFIPILREQNEKYKAVFRLFVLDYGASPIKENGFEIILENHFPGVTEKMKSPRTGRENRHAYARGL